MTQAVKPRDNRAWYLVAPVMVSIVFTAVIPLMMVINYSVQDIFGQSRLFVGADWFNKTLEDPAFRGSFLRNLAFSIQVLIIQIPLGIVLGLGLPKKGWRSSMALVLMAMPLLIPFNVVGTIWLVFARGDIGLGGYFLNNIVGLDINYAQDSFDAWTTVLVMDTWHWTPLVALLVYAGLRAIPDAYYQAATIDGASKFAIFRYVQLPRLRGVLTIAVLLRFMDSFMIFTEPFVLTGGGPGDTTNFLSISLAQLAQAFNLGPAAAYSLVYFFFIQLSCFIFFTILKRF